MDLTLEFCSKGSRKLRPLNSQVVAHPVTEREAAASGRSAIVARGHASSRDFVLNRSELRQECAMHLGRAIP